MSLRTKVLLITVGGAILPLALVGLWLTAGASRSGAELLRDRLDTTLTRVAVEVGDQWVGRRSVLLELAEDTVMRRALEESATPASMPLPSLSSRFDDLRDA